MPNAPQLEWKTVPLVDAKVAGDGSGRLTGYASVFGGLDSYGDTIQPGAYTATLDEFVKSGFIAWSHNWDQMIGTVSSATQDSKGLLITADFHSTPEAQQARTIAAERLARGKSMGLSIGYVPTKWSYQEDPTSKAQIRVLEEIKLFETSLVAIPADPFALATGVKSHPLTERPSSLPQLKAADDEPVTDLEPPEEPNTERFADHAERVLLELSAFTERTRELLTLRQQRREEPGKAGRVLSEANRQRISALMEQLGELLASAEPVKADELAPDPEAEKASPVQSEVDAILARYEAREEFTRDVIAPYLRAAS